MISTIAECLISFPSINIYIHVHTKTPRKKNLETKLIEIGKLICG